MAVVGGPSPPGGGQWGSSRDSRTNAGDQRGGRASLSGSGSAADSNLRPAELCDCPVRSRAVGVILRLLVSHVNRNVASPATSAMHSPALRCAWAKCGQSSKLSMLRVPSSQLARVLLPAATLLSLLLSACSSPDRYKDLQLTVQGLNEVDELLKIAGEKNETLFTSADPASQTGLQKLREARSAWEEVRRGLDVLTSSQMREVPSLSDAKEAIDDAVSKWLDAFDFTEENFYTASGEEDSAGVSRRLLAATQAEKTASQKVVEAKKQAIDRLCKLEDSLTEASPGEFAPSGECA